jgi:hypothetical protein
MDRLLLSAAFEIFQDISLHILQVAAFGLQAVC